MFVRWVTWLLCRLGQHAADSADSFPLHCPDCKRFYHHPKEIR